MHRKPLAVLGVTALLGAALACDRNANTPTAPSAASVVTANAAADGSTLKVTAPTVQSPVNDFLFQNPPITLSATASSGKYNTVAPQYHFQVIDPSGGMNQEAVVNGTSWQINPDLLAGRTRYTWRVRAEMGGGVGPWSSTASFIAPDPALINDPLTDGRTTGTQVGGHFVLGQGWMADTTADGIDWDVPMCISCKLEFDATNFGRGDEDDGADLKWISMADPGGFSGFQAFRDGPWKMHLERRSDGDGTGMKLIWRNGAAGGGEPGDHVAKEDPGPDWRDNEVYHFELRWDPNGFVVKINGETWFQDGFGGNAYAPSPLRISLGTRLRNETMYDAIWRNVKLTKQ